MYTYIYKKKYMLMYVYIYIYIFWGCFSSKVTGQLIAIRRIMKSEDSVKILDEIYNYNLDLGH